MSKKLSRRTFTKTGILGTAAGLTVLQTTVSRARILGANDRIRCGYIGIANRGGQLLKAFGEHADQEVAALCDVDQNTLDKVANDYENRPFASNDFRKLLDRNDLDAIVLATPDHWHAIQTVEACKAGKDVYVEKPLCVSIFEGRTMVKAAEKYRRIVQVGTHRRSSPLFQKVAASRLEERIGHVTVARCYRPSNMFPDGIGKAQPGDVPPGLDWDLWLGPRPMRPFQATIAPYKFRWWDLYSSQMGNWGVHFLDAIRWILGDRAPSSVCSMGGNYTVDDDRTIPDTLEACFTFSSKRLVIFGQYEACGNPAVATNEKYRALGEIELRGTQGTMYISEYGYTIKPERGGQFQKADSRMKEEKSDPKDGLRNHELTVAHARNFLDCLRSRKTPNCDLETGHRSTSMSLIANISLALGRRLDWDPENERFTNCDEANKLLHYEYRKPWKLEI